jgi:uncharacterized membrane protein YebE (DUF533 family)
MKNRKPSMITKTRDEGSAAAEWTGVAIALLLAGGLAAYADVGARRQSLPSAAFARTAPVPAARQETDAAGYQAMGEAVEATPYLAVSVRDAMSDGRLDEREMRDIAPRIGTDRPVTDRTLAQARRDLKDQLKKTETNR